MFIINALIAFGNWFWGIPILILLGCGGLYVTIRVGFLQFRHFGYICSQTFGKMFAKPETDDGVSPFAAACTALASSIGASNIVGVPVAIASVVLVQYSGSGLWHSSEWLQSTPK